MEISDSTLASSGVILYEHAVANFSGFSEEISPVHGSMLLPMSVHQGESCSTELHVELFV